MTPQELKDLAHASSTTASLQVLVSMGTCGRAAGTGPIHEAFLQATAERDDIQVVETGCMGLCFCEPSIELLETASGRRRLFGNVTAEQVPVILDAGVDGGAADCEEVERTWYYPDCEDPRDEALQARIVLRNSGRIDPERIGDAIANGAYLALCQVLEAGDPAAVISTISASGLRGRGGGGFPTGTKWGFAADQESDEKYVICNADEGDPGAFMDRAVLEGDPHAVLEAMAIAGFAIGASEGVIYVRAEYPLAVQRLEMAIKQATERHLLGEGILGTDFSFHVRIKLGAGAFVCGEETALIRSIEGKRGMPTFKPPFPAVEGLWKKPTIVNNVETFANIPCILRKGPDWFRSIGTADSPGTKVFSLTGKVNQVGLIEVPMGMTLEQIIFGLGGGIPDGKAFKAVQTGGPSGGALTAEHIATRLDYDSLKALGSMMGSGGMIVMDEDDCMVDVAKFFLSFTMDESCGKCTPCRVGGRQLWGLLEKITTGNGSEEDLETIADLSEAMCTASLCGLGTTAPNPVLSTIANFRDEYMAHIVDKRCPAGRCANLVTYTIDAELCTGCTLCARRCPVSCITGRTKEEHEIDQDACIHCGVCYDVCKFSAVERS